MDRIVILMSSSPEHRSVFAFPWHDDSQPESGFVQRLEPFYKWCSVRWKRAETLREKTSSTPSRIGGSFDQTLWASALIVLPKAFAGWDAVYPEALTKARALLPFVPLASTDEDALEHDPAWEILAEFQKLDASDQDKAAKNLALLWGALRGHVRRAERVLGGVANGTVPIPGKAHGSLSANEACPRVECGFPLCDRRVDAAVRVLPSTEKVGPPRPVPGQLRGCTHQPRTADDACDCSNRSAFCSFLRSLFIPPKDVSLPDPSRKVVIPEEADPLPRQKETPARRQAQKFRSVGAA